MDDATQLAVREAVGVFPSQSALDAAVNALTLAGFTHAAISILSLDAPSSLHGSAEAIADDPATPRTDFVDGGSKMEGATEVVAVPLLIGGFAGAWSAAATGGALAAAIGATLTVGAAGVALGALLLYAVSQRHSEKIAAQLATGGLILWVNTPDQAAEDLALSILERCGATSSHIHSIVGLV